MNDTLYKLMNWPEIEAIVYSEHDNPHQVLGVHSTKYGKLYTAFDPNAETAVLILDANGKLEEIPMEKVDEGGFFACLASEGRYRFRFTYPGGERVCEDAYRFEPQISEQDCREFNAGIHYTIYEKLGAHPMKIDGVSGTYFAVWAPFALRVSVVGDFNHWDGRLYPMRRLGGSGIFELFIPDVVAGDLYKFELKAKGGLTYLKADPYANAAELRPGTASRVADLRNFEWTDGEYMKDREEIDFKASPMSVYEVHLGSWKKPEEQNGSFYNYRELAVMLAEYVKKTGYTHIELMPLMEHPLDASWGYQVTGYYAVTSRYGTPEDFMFFVDYMHKQGIGVILDWVPAHFPRDTFGLSNFDGTCLYEHQDPRKGSHPHWGTLIFNYGRPEVSNFLIANALFWLEKYHVDGIRMDAVASMLYLDYGKSDGEWVANMYGGNENLEAIELLKHLNSIAKKRVPGALMIAEESTAWPKITGDLNDEGLGFDFKWNMGWMNDFTTYMRQDPLFRRGCHGLLTFSMIYAYSENFILVLSHDEVVHGKGSMLGKMPGTYEEKFANLRVAYCFMMCHPGKKLLFMGQDMAQLAEWNEEKSLEWHLLTDPVEGDRDGTLNAKIHTMVKDLNELYVSHPALYKLDQDPDGFEWMSCLDADHSIVTFVRKTENPEESLFVVCNFTPVVYEKQSVGVPFPGKYKEIFNSDSVHYGGSGHVNARLKQSKEERVDGRDNSIQITLPPLGCAIFTCTPIRKEK
ncbi:MAG: 1,4-alpha-glucan branching protein GlgB [Lachnospiraceae bacterium]|nr:1,4-alpha-glucan branching protein GlgB [Lachnospiraceae bacterium]